MGKMTELRKKAQDKLRRKFGWKSNTNYNRGCILQKSDVYKNAVDAKSVWGKSVSVVNGRPCNRVVDLDIVFDNNPIGKDREVEFCLQEYADFGLQVPEDSRFSKLGMITAHISLEELDLIYKIAHEMYNENKHLWYSDC